MRVEVLKLGAGPEGVRLPGMVYEVSKDEAEALIADGAAQLAMAAPPAPPPDAPTAAEREAMRVTATAPAAPERAVTRKGGRK